jgi:hypothetical protein
MQISTLVELSVCYLDRRVSSERLFSLSDTSGLKKGKARSYYRPENCFVEDLNTEKKKGSGLGL